MLSFREKFEIQGLNVILSKGELDYINKKYNCGIRLLKAAAIFIFRCISKPAFF